MAALTSSRKRTASGVFDAELGLDELLDVVAELARSVSAQDPAAVSQRVWDRALATSPYDGRAPQARAIVMRLSAANAVRVSWRQVIEASLKPRRTQQMTLSTWTRNDPVVHLEARHVHYALRRADMEMGTCPATPQLYTQARDTIVLAYRRRGVDLARAERKLPTANQLVSWARAGRPTGPNYWDDVLAAAGYAATAPDDHDASHATGLPAAEVTAHFVRFNNFWPTWPMLRVWAKEADVVMHRPRGEKWAHARQLAAALLVAEGYDVDAVAELASGDGAYTSWVFPDAGIPGAPRRSDTDREWSQQRIVVKLREFDQVIPVHEGRSESTYRRLRQTGWPSVSKVIRHGGWSNLLAEAQQLNRAGASMPTGDEPRKPYDRQHRTRIYDDECDGLIRSRSRRERPPVKPRRRPRPGPDRAARSRGQSRRSPPARSSAAREPGRRGRVTAVSLTDLVASGVLDADETLVAAYKGGRFEATFDATTGAVDVTGEGRFKSLTAAAMHCQGNGKTANGWKFWCIQRSGRAMSLHSLRVGPAE